MPENQASRWSCSSGSSVEPARCSGRSRISCGRRSAPGRSWPGERLPSSRVLAADLGVSRGVVSDAYGQLAAEGWLVRRARAAPPRAARGDGSRRRASRPETRAAPAAPGSDATIARSRRLAPEAPVRYDLRPGRPDLARFPRADWCGR